MLTPLPPFFLLIIIYIYIYIHFLFVMVLTPFFQAVQATFRLEEITNSCYQQLEDEKKRQAAAVQTLNIAEQNNVELNKKLADEVHARRSADSALKGAQRPVEDQRKRLCENTDQLNASKEYMVALKEQLEEAQRLKDQAEKSKAEAEMAKIEAEKARDEAKQKDYDLGVAETEETLRAEFPAVCRIYYTKTWNEALNRARVKASTELRKAENIYYPPAIRASNLPSTQGEVASTVADPTKEAQPQDPPLPSQQGPTKELEAPQEISSDKAAVVPEVGAVSQGFQQDLASTIMLVKGASKDKEGTTTIEANNPANKTSKLQIKLKK